MFWEMQLEQNELFSTNAKRFFKNLSNILNLYKNALLL